MTFRLLLTIAALLAAVGLWAQNGPNLKIEPFAMVQLWSGYSMGQEIFNPISQQYEAVDDRFNTFMRRGRIGFRGRPYEFLGFTFTSALDGLGKDVLAAIPGPANNLSAPRIFVWDAFLQWKILPRSELLNLTGGYFRPQLSRESITPAWAVSSMEKALSQTYIRKHLTGIGTGRAAGLNLGGLWLPDGARWGLNYNLGAFNPVYQDKNGNSMGERAAPLFVGRTVLYIGDPEQTQYSVSYESNYFGRRKGLSLAAGGAYQGATRLFDKSYTASADFLFNWGPLHIDGEWNGMWRSGDRNISEMYRQFTYFSQTGHARAGYNIPVGRKYILAPSLMIMRFQGARDLRGMGDALAVGAHSGTETTYDAGINWFIDEKRLRVILHYTWNTGDAGEAEGTTFTGNSFFFEPEAGAIRRGNWIGLGLNAIF